MVPLTPRQKFFRDLAVRIMRESPLALASISKTGIRGEETLNAIEKAAALCDEGISPREGLEAEEWEAYSAAADTMSPFWWSRNAVEVTCRDMLGEGADKTAEPWLFRVMQDATGRVLASEIPLPKDWGEGSRQLKEWSAKSGVLKQRIEEKIAAAKREAPPSGPGDWLFERK